MGKGMVIGGSFSQILAREKQDDPLALGELLIADTPKGKVLLQVVDLAFGSQISQQNLELVSGMKLEENTSLEFMDPHLRNYTLATLKSMLLITSKAPISCKVLPAFFSEVREVQASDITFLSRPAHPLYIGHLRSGSNVVDVPIFLQGRDVLSHHVLIPAATGKGKSNLTSVMLWQSVEQDYCGVLVLDPHDEYYGRTGLGLKDHPRRDRVAYYTPNAPPPGALTLKFSLSLLRPHHFNGVVDWTSAQRDCLESYYRTYGDQWISSFFTQPDMEQYHEGTLAVVRRKLLHLLDLDLADDKLYCNGCFDHEAGKNTVTEIGNELESGKLVIIDTSRFDGAAEILIGSLIATDILSRYKSYKTQGVLASKPVVAIFLEEAPRVLGKEVLEKGPNIFSTIAREGRKFQVGLVAITQLPSMIPRDILANMNTKIILGTEMRAERQAIIESAAQDLSQDDRTIASLDKGEALITSNFARFATPVKVPLFEDFARRHIQNSQPEHKPAFGGIKR